MFDQKIIDFLRLTRNEIRVAEFLKKVPSSQVADIVVGTHIPRMTVYLALSSLKQRGLATYSRKGKRRFWILAEGSAIAAHIMTSAYALSDLGEIRITAKNSGFAIHQGLKGMYRVWQELQKLTPHTRVQAIQPTSAMRYALKNLDWTEKIAPLQENIIRKQLIIDGVLPDDCYTFMMEQYKYDKNLQKKMLESFLGRAADITFVSKDYFRDAESELIILPTVAYLSDWKNEVSIEIRNPAMLHFLKELYSLAKGYGRKINQEEYIKRLLAKI
jgi:hypothetical protein